MNVSGQSRLGLQRSWHRLLSAGGEYSAQWLMEAGKEGA